ncbi:MAG: ABC transporter permease [Thermoproteota archaeon]|nr:ABC transporter permease [Candidatus Brockarchaeota archaeon]
MKVHENKNLLESVRDFWNKYKKNKGGVIGLYSLLIILLVAVVVPFLPIYDPNSIQFGSFMPPSLAHLFGTDELGRDVLSRVLWGTRTSLSVGFGAALVSSLAGIILGSIAGYFGGLFDEVISRITEIFLMIPAFFLILLIASIYGSSIYYVILVIGLTTWPSTARIIRAQTLSLKEREFIYAQKVIGSSASRVLFIHLIPNAIQPVIANSILQVASAILLEAGLSFLGLGDPNLISWGKMIYNGSIYIFSSWWIAFFPGLAIVITVASLNMIGDALATVLNPRLEERGA